MRSAGGIIGGVWVVCAACVVLACSGGDGDGGGLEVDSSFLLPDAAGDGGTGGTSGTGGAAGGADAGDASAVDAAPDSGGEAGPADTGSAEASDASGDAESDAGLDASSDAGIDASPDASSDAGLDASSDAGADAADAQPDVAPVCQAGEFQCTGDELQGCNASQTGFDPVATCKVGLCDASQGVCLDCGTPADCAASECMVATCVQNQCGAAPASAGTSCGSGGVCNGNGACGVCVPGKTGCAGNVPQTCSAVGQWQSQAACGGATPQCEDGVCEPAAPSCSALAKSCGAAGAGYCCSSRVVAGASFKRSYDGVTYGDPSYPASVTSYSLDVYEVSVARFREFVSAGEGLVTSAPAAGSAAHPKISGSGWKSSWNSSLESTTTALMAALSCDPALATWTDSPGANETRPMNCVTWYEAFAFCAWDGARIPTEAEWNLAAAGGSEQRVYPWSSPPVSTIVGPSYASYWLDGANLCMGDGVAGCTLDDLIAVGSKPPGNARYGQSDMAGNVWEWTLDTWANPYAITSCTDCADLSGSSRVIRGGSFFGNPSTILASNRGFAPPGSRFTTVGLRCARDP